MPDLLGAWRPEGWVNPEDLPEDGPLDGLDDCGIYEAGADAMLEALKAGGIRCRTDDADIPEFIAPTGSPASWHLAEKVGKTRFGWLIFIPEAQE